MGKGKKNPADAQRRKEKDKQIKRNKEERQYTKEVAKLHDADKILEELKHIAKNEAAGYVDAVQTKHKRTLMNMHKKVTQETKHKEKRARMEEEKGPQGRVGEEGKGDEGEGEAKRPQLEKPEVPLAALLGMLPPPPPPPPFMGGGAMPGMLPPPAGMPMPMPVMPPMAPVFHPAFPVPAFPFPPQMPPVAYPQVQPPPLRRDPLDYLPRETDVSVANSNARAMQLQMEKQQRQQQEEAERLARQRELTPQEQPKPIVQKPTVPSKPRKIIETDVLGTVKNVTVSIPTAPAAAPAPVPVVTAAPPPAKKPGSLGLISGAYQKKMPTEEELYEDLMRQVGGME